MNHRIANILKKSISWILTFCIIFTSAYSNAYAGETIELVPAECIVDVNWEKLQNAVLTAIREGKQVTEFEDAEFLGESEETAAEYRQLLSSSSAPLYEVEYAFQKSQFLSKTGIRIFVRTDEAVVNSDADELEEEYLSSQELEDGEHADEYLENDTALPEMNQDDTTVTESMVATDSSARRAVDNSQYSLTGDEQLYILYSNKSSRDVAFQLRVNGMLTPQVTICSAAVLEENIQEILDETVAESESESETALEESEDGTGSLAPEGSLSGSEVGKETTADTETTEADSTVTETAEADLDVTESTEADLAVTETTAAESKAEESKANQAETKADKTETETKADTSDTAKEDNTVSSDDKTEIKENVSSDDSKAEVEAPADKADTKDEAGSNDSSDEPKSENSDSDASGGSDSVQVSRSGLMIPMVAGQYEEEEISAESHNTVLNKNAAVVLMTLTLGTLGTIVKTHISSLTVINEMTGDAWEDGALDYTVTIENSDGTEKLGKGAENDYSAGTSVISFSLAPGASMTISNIDDKSTYIIEQSEHENVTCSNVTTEKKKQNWSGSGDGTESDSEYNAENNWGYKYEPYSSLMEQTEALVNAMRRCKKATGNNSKEMKALIGSASINNEAYRNRVVADYNNGSWPTAAAEGMEDLLASYFASTALSIAKGDKEADYALEQGVQYYLNVYVRPGNATEDMVIIPYISKSENPNTGDKWRAFALYDTQTNEWYGRTDRKYVEISGFYQTYADVQELIKADGHLIPFASGDVTTSDSADSTITGSFNGNGFAYAVKVQYDNVYKAIQEPVIPDKKMHTVKYMDGQSDTPLKVFSVPDGETIDESELPEATTVLYKKFVRWDVDYTQIPVTADSDVAAVYTLSDTIIYDVTFDYLKPDGSQTSVIQKVASGMDATAPNIYPVEGKEFVGWDKEFSKVVSDMTVTAEYEELYYTVTFKYMTPDGEWTSSDQVVEKAGSATAPVLEEVAGKRFTGWDVKFINITQNIVVTAQYEEIITSYNVTFVYKKANGELTSDTQVVKKSESAIEPAIEILLDEEFTGWDRKFDNITEDITVNAQYRVLMQNVTFRYILANGDWTETSQEVRKYTDAIPPELDTPKDINFIGWDKGFEDVTEDMLVTAKYEDITHSVEFQYLDADGSTISEFQTVKKFTSAKAPTPVLLADQTFTGWDEEFSNVTKDITVKALYKDITHNVMFRYLDANGTMVSEMQVVMKYTAAQEPTIPTLKDKEFTGWDKKFDQVTGDMTVTAQYKDITFTVTFQYLKADGTNAVETQTVKKYENAKAPTPDVLETLKFQGWDKNFNQVTSDTTVTAQYAPYTYTVEFRFMTSDQEWTSELQTVKKFGSATEPALVDVDGKDFTGWDTDFTNVTKNLVVSAGYKNTTFVVTFNYKKADGSQAVVTKNVIKYEDAEAPVPDLLKDQEFTGWDNEFTNVTADVEVTAQYKDIMQTVIFKYLNADGSQATEAQSVKRLTGATAPTIVALGDQEFTRWDNDFSSVTEDITVTAQYKDIMQTVIFKYLNADGSNATETQSVKRLTGATAPTLVALGDQEFTRWDNDFSSVTDDITVTAQYKDIMQTVIFKYLNADGSQATETQSVKRLTGATAPTIVALGDQEFMGWDNDFSSVTDDITVTAQYKDIMQTVTFKYLNADGSKATETQSVKRLTGATAPTIVVLGDQEFTSWDNDFSRVTEDVIVTAQYKDIMQTVIFKYLNADGSQATETQSVKRLTGATAPTIVALGDQEFTSWDNDFSRVTDDITVTAQYKDIMQTVTFKYLKADGSTATETQSVKRFTDATAPTPETLDTQEFIGWDRAFANITEDITVNAQYKDITYTVTFRYLTAGGEWATETQTVKKSESAVIPALDTIDGKEFTGWDNSHTNITKDTVITAVYQDAEPIVPDTEPDEGGNSGSGGSGGNTGNEPETKPDQGNNGGNGGNTGNEPETKPDEGGNGGNTGNEPETKPDEGGNGGNTGNEPETKPDEGNNGTTPETKPDNGNNGNTGNNGGNSNGGNSTGGNTTGSGGGTSGPGNNNNGFVTGGPGDTNNTTGDTVTINPEDVPLASAPTNLSNDLNAALTNIDDGEIPLAALPKTGEDAGSAIAIALSGILLALYMAIGKKKERG